MQNLKPLYEAVRKTQSTANIHAYSMALQGILERNNPMEYISNLEYIITNSIGLESFNGFINEHGLPIVMFNPILENLNESIDRCKIYEKDDSSFVETLEMLTSYMNSHKKTFLMYETCKWDIDDYDRYIETYYTKFPMFKEHSISKLNTDKLQSTFGNAIISDIILYHERFGNLTECFNKLSLFEGTDSYHTWLYEMSTDDSYTKSNNTSNMPPEMDARYHEYDAIESKYNCKIPESIKLAYAYKKMVISKVDSWDNGDPFYVDKMSATDIEDEIKFWYDEMKKSSEQPGNDKAKALFTRAPIIPFVAIGDGNFYGFDNNNKFIKLIHDSSDFIKDINISPEEAFIQEDNISNLESKSLSGKVNRIINEKHIIFKESMILGYEDDIIYTESEINAIMDLISFKEYMALNEDTVEGMLRAQDEVYSLYSELSGVFADNDSILKEFKVSLPWKKVSTDNPDEIDEVYVKTEQPEDDIENKMDMVISNIKKELSDSIISLLNKNSSSTMSVGKEVNFIKSEFDKPNAGYITHPTDQETTIASYKLTDELYLGKQDYLLDITTSGEMTAIQDTMVEKYTSEGIQYIGLDPDDHHDSYIIILNDIGMKRFGYVKKTDTVTESARTKKTGEMPAFLSRNHNSGYGEDKYMADDVAGAMDVDDFKRGKDDDVKPETTSDTSSDIEPFDYDSVDDSATDTKSDDKSDSDSSSKKSSDSTSGSSSNTSPATNYYYYTYNNSNNQSTNNNTNSHNQHSTDRSDHSTKTHNDHSVKNNTNNSTTSNNTNNSTNNTNKSNNSTNTNTDNSTHNNSSDKSTHTNHTDKSNNKRTGTQNYKQYKDSIYDEDNDDDVQEESFGVNMFGDIFSEDVGDADDMKPKSDNPVKDFLTDVDRKMVATNQKMKKKVQAGQNNARAFAKPVKRTTAWISKMVNEWQDTRETKLKEKIADPKERSALMKALKLSISVGSLAKAGLLFNPLLAGIYALGKIDDGKKYFKIRNDMIGELKAELEVIDVKIQDADRNGDDAAKYRLIRFKNEYKKKLAKVGAANTYRKAKKMDRVII